MTTIHVIHARSLLSAIALALASTPAGAADGVEEVTVTATKMGATNLQETPIAISAFTADYLEKTGTLQVRDLVFGTPNLVIAQNGNSAQVYIRGIGSNNSFAGGEASSTVHLDGVYIARPGAVFFNFLDVERIEVLRGPQGTLYGRNSVGGTINIISRKPDSHFRAKVQATLGDYNARILEGYVSGPLAGDVVSASVSAMRGERDGYFTNVTSSGNDRGSQDDWSVRAQLRVAPSEDFEFLLRADYLDDRGIAAGNQALLVPFFPVAGGPENPATAAIRGDWHKVALNSPSSFQRKIPGVSAELNYQISDALALKSLTAYRGVETDTFNDTDATDLNRQTTQLSEDQDQLSQEFNLTGTVGDAQYVTGLYYIDEHIETGGDGVYAIPTNLKTRPTPTVDTKAYAAFGQVDYSLTHRFTLTAGLRYSNEDKEFDQRLDRVNATTGASQAGFPRLYLREGSYSAWTPKLGLQFQYTPDVMFYTSATRGFKSGGFNFSSANALHGYGPEKLWSYEAGVKSEFAGDRIRLNATAFSYDYEDLQVQAFITPGVTDITNAADASVEGIELELSARPLEALTLGASANWLDATYKNFPAAPITGGTIDASGKRLNSAPKYSYGAYGQYEQRLANSARMGFRLEYSWKDRQWFTVVNDSIQTTPSYGLLNMSLSYSSADSHWQVVGYGRNLTDEQYLVSTGSFTAAPSGTPGDPRTYGLRVSYSY